MSSSTKLVNLIGFTCYECIFSFPLYNFNTIKTATLHFRKNLFDPKQGIRKLYFKSV